MKKKLSHPFSKRLFTGVLFAFIFLFTGPLLNSAVDKMETLYYERIPVTSFLDIKSIFVDNLCLGEDEQGWSSIRFVSVDNGLEAEITRELFRQDGNLPVKIYEEKATVTIEQREDGISLREQTLFKKLPVGEYFWQIKYNHVFLPNGVVRSDVPVVETNHFFVTDCEI